MQNFEMSSKVAVSCGGGGFSSPWLIYEAVSLEYKALLIVLYSEFTVDIAKVRHSLKQ